VLQVSRLRPLLRWTSLVAGAILLAVLGEARTHQQSFVLFLAIVVALAIGIVAMFVATGGEPAARSREEDGPW
jgi:peptidoglycan/LPS O-acetylase OafA/YrhL